MEPWLSGLAQHGYSILFAAVFLEAVGLPIPAALALLITAAASARGSLQLTWALASALSAMMLADLLMFLLGRYTGWWLLGVLCRLSFNAESCMLRSAASFHRRGRLLLLFAKFVPGINAMAPPLAGSMNMRLIQFLALDLGGASLYIGSYMAVGFLFSGALESMVSGYQTLSRFMGWILIALIAVYIGVQLRMWLKTRGPGAAPVAPPSDVASAVSDGDAVIYDVRSHGYYDAKATRIRGSRRLDPNTLHGLDERLPGDLLSQNKLVFLYCT
jgi:membrane protein DedA with SNARE-associated domain